MIKNVAYEADVSVVIDAERGLTSIHETYVPLVLSYFAPFGLGLQTN